MSPLRCFRTLCGILVLACWLMLAGCSGDTGEARDSGKGSRKSGGLDAAPSRERTVTLERVKLADPASNTDVALTFLKPKGWQVTGGVKWSALSAHQIGLEMTVADPGGAEQLELFSTVWFTHASRSPFPRKPLSPYSGKLWLEPHTPVDLLEKITIPSFRRAYQPRITAREELPDLSASLSRAVGQPVKAARVRIEYTRNGVAMEEDFYMSLSYLQNSVAGLGEMVTWSPVLTPFAIRAEKGKLDAASPRLLSIAFSFNYTPEFYKTIALAQARFTGVLANIQAIDRQDAARIYESHVSIAKIHQDMRDHRDASIDRRNAARRDLLGGVAPYTDGGTTYVLPHTHKFQWAGPSGTVILTDDPNYDPNQRSGHNWARLRETER